MDDLSPWELEADPSKEGEDDLVISAGEVARGAVLWATDWTAETILNQLQRGNIELNPRFQRRDAWKTPARKSRFIESIVLGLPIPQLVLAERRDRRGSYVVIDGKQRLLSLRQFAAGPSDEFTALRLEGLEVRADLNGLTLEDLKADPAHSDDLAAFENQTIRTVVVKGWTDEKLLYLVFLRLNTGSVPLSPQELRQALHPGPFIDFADEFAQSSDLIHDALGVARPDFRMRDVELLVRFLAFGRYLDRYAGNLKEFLDDSCESLNQAWPDEEERIRREAAQVDAVITTTEATFAVGAFRRWSGGHWERSFNRAVFDAMAFYFRDLEVAAAAVEARDEVMEAFKRLSETDAQFAQALQTTTKTVAATHARLHAWGRALEVALDVTLPVPELQGNRIRYA